MTSQRQAGAGPKVTGKGNGSSQRIKETAIRLDRPIASVRSRDRSREALERARERRQMIAEAAYYMAVQRGFETGDPVRDWLEAELFIDKMLKRGMVH